MLRKGLLSVNFLYIFVYLYIVKPRPKTQTPKAQPQPSQTKSKGTGADTKILWTTHHPTTHPITFRSPVWDYMPQVPLSVRKVSQVKVDIKGKNTG